jgi:hypothetical protein
VGQCQCLSRGKRAKWKDSEMIPVVDWVLVKLTLDQSANHRAIPMRALAGLNAQAISAMGNFGPDMGMAVEDKVCTIGWGIQRYKDSAGATSNEACAKAGIWEKERYRTKTMTAYEFAKEVLGYDIRRGPDELNKLRMAMYGSILSWFSPALRAAFKASDRRDTETSSQ